MKRGIKLMKIHMDIQNVYINNFYFRSNLLILYIGIILLTVLSLKYKKQISITIDKTIKIRIRTIKLLAVYLCTILPINYIVRRFDISQAIMSKLSFISKVSSLINLSILIIGMVYISFYKNKDTIITLLKKPLLWAIYIFVLIEAMYGELNFLYWYNIGLLIFLSCLSALIDSVIIKIKSENYTEYNINNETTPYINYYPIEKPDDLFPERNWQKERLIDIIQNNDAIKTICISGEWGQGKTSFINIVSKELSKKNYPIIRINALDFSGLASLYKYYFEQIEGIICKSGYYNGFASEFSGFTKKLADIILDYTNVKVSVNQTKDYTYISEKQELQNILTQSLGEKKLVVIVDDIERCDPDLALKYIRFIKEIATFDKSITLFLSDYKELLKLPDVNDKYIQKFIDYRFDLRVSNYSEILQHIKKKNPNLYEFLDGVNINIENELDDVFLRFEEEYTKLKAKRSDIKTTDDNYKLYTKHMEECLDIHVEFEKLINNPRTINKLCENIFDKRNTLKNMFAINNDCLTFFRNIKLEKCIISICMIQTLFPIEYEEIKKISLARYIENLKGIKNRIEKDIELSKNTQIEIKLIIELCDELWFEESIFTTTSTYLQMNAVEFCDKLISSPEYINNMINPYTTVEDACMSYIKNDRWEELDSITYIDLLSMILNRYAYKNTEEGTYILEKTFSHFMKKEWEKNDHINECFGIFAYAQGIQRWFSPEIHVLKIFYDTIKNNNYKITNTERISEVMVRFSQLYICNSIDAINNVLRYNINKFQIEQFNHENLLVKVWNEKTFDSMLKTYINILLNGQHESQDALQVINNLIEETVSYLRDVGFIEYEDIKAHIIHAKELLIEYTALKNILDLVQEKGGNITENIETNDYKTNIQNYIDYIKDLQEINYDKEVNNLHKLSNSLFYNEENSELNNLDKEVITLYNELLTIFSEKTGYNIYNFRLHSLLKMKNIDECVDNN